MNKAESYPVKVAVEIQPILSLINQASDRLLAITTDPIFVKQREATEFFNRFQEAHDKIINVLADFSAANIRANASEQQYFTAANAHIRANDKQQ